MSRGSQRTEGGNETVPEIMTIDDLEAYMQLSKSSLYKLAQAGRIPGKKVGKHWRFRKGAIDHWLDERDHTHGSRAHDE